MNCGLLAFVILFALPMALIIEQLDPAAQQHVAIFVGVAVLVFVAALQVPRLLRRLRRRRMRRPSARDVTRLDWPANLTRAELEAFCAGWLRAHGWQVTLTTDPAPEAEGVYLLAMRGDSRIAVLCDQRGEDFNPAAIRIFAQESGRVGATQSVLLTLSPHKLPSPAEAAARDAGVRLLRVPELAQLDALAEPVAG